MLKKFMQKPVLTPSIHLSEYAQSKIN